MSDNQETQAQETSENISAHTNIYDTVKDEVVHEIQDDARENVSQANKEEGRADKAGWYYDDNLAGNGDRPDWHSSKFKTIVAQAKAYPELEKRFGSFKGAPEEYDLSFSKDMKFQLDPAHPVLAGFLENAKKANASQEFVESALKLYANSQEQGIPNVEEELKILGEEGKASAKKIYQWFQNRLSSEEVKDITSTMSSAKLIRIMDKLRGTPAMSNDQPSTSIGQKGRSVGEIQGEMMSNMDKYQKDVHYRQKLFDELSKAVDNSKKKS